MVFFAWFFPPNAYHIWDYCGAKRFNSKKFNTFVPHLVYVRLHVLPKRMVGMCKKTELWQYYWQLHLEIWCVVEWYIRHIHIQRHMQRMRETERQRERALWTKTRLKRDGKNAERDGMDASRNSRQQHLRNFAYAQLETYYQQMELFKLHSINLYSMKYFV